MPDRAAILRKLNRGHGITDEELEFISGRPAPEQSPDAPKEFARCQSRWPRDKHFQCMFSEPHRGIGHRDAVGHRW